MLPVIRGLGPPVNLRASRWTEAGIGRMKCERICVRREGKNNKSKVSARTPGFVCVVMAVREECIIASARMAVCWERDLGRSSVAP